MARDFWVYRYTLYDPLVMGWCKINPKGQFLIYNGAYRIILDRKKGIARLQPGLYDDFSCSLDRDGLKHGALEDPVCYLFQWIFQK